MTAAARRLPLRLLTAVPPGNGHDGVIATINLEFARQGIEVIYLGEHQPAAAIARAAVQEDVHAIGLGGDNGGQVAFFREILQQLRARGGRNIGVFDTGGGTLAPDDARAMKRHGVDRIIFGDTPLPEIVRTITQKYGRRLKRDASLRGDRALARAITLAEMKTARGALRANNGHAGRVDRKSTFGGSRRPFVIGITGPGGGGKSRLIGELTSRFLHTFPRRRLAILANDPSRPESGGAVLGDRGSALPVQDDRVFFRSLATRGNRAGLSAAIPGALDVLRRSGEFDLIFVESVGIGQEGGPFESFSRTGNKLIDAGCFVLTPHYGGPIQLQKMALLTSAEFVVLNKCDDPRAAAAKTEVSARLGREARARCLHTTTAAEQGDGGIDGLFGALCERAGLEPAGGERPCYLQSL